MLFAGALAVHARSVVLIRHRDAGRARQAVDIQALAEQYWWAWLVNGAAIVCMVTAFAGLRGQPTTVHSGYFLDNHGSLIRVSHDAYVHALAAQERLFTSVACTLYCFAAIINSDKKPGNPV